ncbi:NADH dehydrogenase (plasmid) [Halostagnicola larsenii XH-48]|uniref:NADH dehydrogenase n=1 Tax=Halostagnicola larsenii XH-48 TaxID=797299 RepID=W0JSW6_9EURY|nr:NADH-ubiquinone oxidoreductase-F iron-sulfur binding region domain-containing protein [Halostagnicola larsenii]AHG01756.1 NADH dehydrogenase [Halostagnicola larsenii XH-48]
MNTATDSHESRPTVRVTVGYGDPPSVARDTQGTAEPDEPHPLERGRKVLQTAQAAASEANVLEVGTTGVHGLEPLVLVTRDGRTAYYPHPSTERVRSLVERAESGSIGEDEPAWVVEHDPDIDALPLPPDGPLAVGTRRILSRCGWTDPERAAPADSGAVAVAREDPNAALEQLATIGVLGRGRGDASQDTPLADDLEIVREATDDPVVVVNANESDSRNRTDRTLLGGSPATVLDGALAVAEIVGASSSDVVVYTNEDDDLIRRRTRRAATAVAALEAEGSADEGVDDEAAPQVVAGPNEYIAGEYTMALEALEGNDRLEARLRPPGPARHGLYGRPTVVSTPRTFAQVRAALLEPGEFDPADADPGTRVITVTGDVESPATVELVTGSSLGVARDLFAGAGRFKMACVGGQFGGFTRSIDQPVSAMALSNADLGTEGVVELFDQSRCAVAAAGERVRFASEENCGRCFPGREGSKQLLHLLRDVYDGTYQDDMIRELARVMQSSSLCDVGRSAGRSVDTALEEFETEFKAHAAGRCPSGACEVSRS